MTDEPPTACCPLPARSLNIGLVAYECLPGLVFVRAPNERGRWMLVNRCVIDVDCPDCKSITGEPCKKSVKRPYYYSGERQWNGYHVQVHVMRTEAAKALHGKRLPPGTPKPKLRIPAEDLTNALTPQEPELTEPPEPDIDFEVTLKQPL